MAAASRKEEDLVILALKICVGECNQAMITVTATGMTHLTTSQSEALLHK